MGEAEDIAQDIRRISLGFGLRISQQLKQISLLSASIPEPQHVDNTEKPPPKGPAGGREPSHVQIVYHITKPMKQQVATALNQN
ncbi:hypothetical protein ACFL4G_03280 [Thermodesulfobacteriota bacterium]